MVPSRPSVTLQLSAGLRDKIVRSGYLTVEDLRAIPQEDLATELKISEAYARELSHQLYPTSNTWTSFSAVKTLEKEKKLTPITTSSAALDRLFGGGQGIPPGKITEICGLPGSGKTQLGMQLCINAQLPYAMGGAEGNSIFIDTEGSFVAKRAAQMAKACSIKLNNLEKDIGTEDHITEKLMQGIQYCRVHSPMELIAMVRMLDGIVQAHPKVVVMNQMSTKIESYPEKIRQGAERYEGLVQPALGETWASPLPIPEDQDIEFSFDMEEAALQWDS
ncbi:DNA repair protein rad51c [Haplosporangium sp. Z 27]|nr:DNA repair protein rad51c [Haplosporangium sp. Z 27]